MEVYIVITEDIKPVAFSVFDKAKEFWTAQGGALEELTPASWSVRNERGEFLGTIDHCVVDAKQV